MSDVDKLCIAVRNEYRGVDDFSKVCTFFDSLYASGRLGIPLSGLLIIGYCYESSVPKPSPAQVKHYLDLWDSLENNHLQEDALNRLFFKLAPGNEDVTDILLKASTLNDFYSTNIFSIFPVAKHIQSLHIDERLKAGDTTLVGDIQHLTINGVEKNF